MYCFSVELPLRLQRYNKFLTYANLKAKKMKKQPKNCIFLHFALFCDLYDNTKSASVTLLFQDHPATFTLSHFHTFLYAEQPFEKFLPHFWAKIPRFLSILPLLSATKMPIFRWLKMQKVGGKGG